MSKKNAFIFPGQGAQYPGMGRDFYETFATAKAVFDEADEILGYRFSDLIFNGSKEELTLTKNSQLAIFITSVAILRVYQEQNPGAMPYVCGGLSLGEYTALVAAQKLTFKQALPLIRARGALMDEACEKQEGTMHVVLGMELGAVEAVLKDISGVWIANLNCPGQIVISGTKEGCEKAAVLLKEQGAKRVLPLDVSGAFHSGLMKPAQDQLAPFIQAVSIHDSPIQLVMNVPGDFVEEIDDMRANMTEQVTKAVRWQSCVEAMQKAGVEQFIEMGPGKTLAGMNKRIGVDVPTLSIEKVEELDCAPVA